MTPEEVAPVRRLINDPCGEDSLKLDIGPLGKQYAPRLREACRKIASDGRGFGRAVYENIPKMMFIFLPLIAAVMFVLYLGSGRYYVEHLLFFVHFHAFFFLGGAAVLLLERLSTWLPWADVSKALEAAGGISDPRCSSSTFRTTSTAPCDGSTTRAASSRWQSTRCWSSAT